MIWVTMNTNLIVVLYQWNQCIHNPNIDIDWPAVHKFIGIETMNWILKQPKTSCQLIVEQVNDGHRLILEFYNKAAAHAYQGLLR